MMTVDESFHLLRVTLEARAVDSQVVSVTSARSDDNTSYVASGIGIAFAESGRSAIVLDASGRTTSDAITSANGVSPIVAAVGMPLLHLASLSTTRNGGRRASVRAHLLALRETYDVIVIDAGCLLSSGTSLEAASVADDIVIALRLGRSAERTDQDLQTLLGERRERIVGIVPTRPSATFAIQRVEPPIRAARPARGNETPAFVVR